MNVLLVTVDCFRYDRCGFNGHHRPTTPNLDQMADSSYVFHNAFSTGPQTVDSFPGFIAGRHSYNGAHCRDNVSWKALPEGSPTLGTLFSDHGYDTAAVLTNTFITEEQNYDAGFDTFDNIEMRGFGGPDTGDSESSYLSRVFDKLTSTARSKLQNQDSVLNPYMALFVTYQYRRALFGWPTVEAEEVIDEFLSTLDDLSEPFFGWTHLMDLHAPIHPSIVDEDLSTANSLFSHFLAEGARDGQIHHPPLDTIYDGALSYVDQQVGRIFDYLEERDILDDTIVIVTGDHGDALYDRGVYGHPAHYMYNELLRVPLLVHVPDTDCTGVHAPFSLAWLHELIGELLDWETEAFPARTARETHIDADPYDEELVVADSITEAGHTVAVQNGRYKYVTHYGGEEIGWKHKIKHDTLYKTTGDRWERHPIDGSEAPAELRERAEKIRIDPRELPSIAHESDEAVLDRLEQLGYKV